MVCVRRPYPLKFFKGCLSQILLDPFLNTWTELLLRFIEDRLVIWFCEGVIQKFYSGAAPHRSSSEKVL